ncbi:hypothetical protein CRE_17438 [Caenorhabditis remanei]|uniref:DUF38 domain-containing protein n=1 Tax=Caenorhabditis remanei TaxID=31234 RepID=E3N219_CAERE|nr:hypothetical protein CRE_17438 [Caenorhabditis remanei]
MKKQLEAVVLLKAVALFFEQFLRYILLPQHVLHIDLKLRLTFLRALSYEDFETVLPFIDPRSFPLKTVATFSDPSTFDSQIVKSAETLNLILFTDQIVTVEDLKKLNNEKVIFERIRYFRIDIIPFIQYHIETKKVVETTFIISTDTKTFIDMMLREFEQTFGEFQCDLDDVNERFLPGSSKFSIPINNESRIQVYVIEDPEEGD